MVKPVDRKNVVTYIVSAYAISVRTACRMASISRTGYHYQPKPNGDEPLRKRLLELASQYPRYGYLMLHCLFQGEGLVINKKHTYRLYLEYKLQVRTKKRKKLTRDRQPLCVPIKVNVRWSMDFVSDQLSNGRRIRILNIVDDYSREMVGQLVDFSITGAQVARFLDQICETRALPGKIVCDNGTEFTSKAMFFWQKDTGVQLGFIQPGKQTQNAFVESLNGKFRNECLNQYWFKSIEEAREEIDAWRHHYNNERPHSALNYMSPVAFAAKAA